MGEVANKIGTFAVPVSCYDCAYEKRRLKVALKNPSRILTGLVCRLESGGSISQEENQILAKAGFAVPASKIEEKV